MVQRTTYLYNGKTIGIESIYTVVAGCRLTFRKRLKLCAQKAGTMDCSALVVVELIVL